jgi:ribosome maturation factor RimP
MTESEELYKDIADTVSGIGLALVDLSVSRTKGGATRAFAVVYSTAGTGIDECARAHRLIQARLEAVLGESDFHLETASPGIDRTIKSSREYGIFIGRGVRLFFDDASELCGRIVSFDGSTVVIATPDGDQSISLTSIRKGKLDYSQEGR